MSVGKLAFGTAALLVGLTAASLAPAQTRDRRLAERVLSQVMKARDALRADCAFDILRESRLGDITCKSGMKTAVGAWDDALTEAGLPITERGGTAERLGLTPGPDDDKASLWRADPKDIARLIANLRLLAGG